MNVYLEFADFRLEGSVVLCHFLVGFGCLLDLLLKFLNFGTKFFGFGSFPHEFLLLDSHERGFLFRLIELTRFPVLLVVLLELGRNLHFAASLRRVLPLQLHFAAVVGHFLQQMLLLLTEIPVVQLEGAVLRLQLLHSL